MGFDSQWAKKKDQSICTANTNLEHPHHGKLLVRIHQAVHNPSAQDTLLLEYQLSQKGCMIDCKPPHHQYPNGTFRTQSFRIPDQPHTLKLDITSCLVTLPHRRSFHSGPNRNNNLRSLEPFRSQFQSYGEHKTPSPILAECLR